MNTRIDTISGLTTFDVQPDSLPNKDNAIVLPGDPLLEPAAHGAKKYINVIVRLRCARATAKDAQAALDGYIASVEGAVNADRTLSGAVDDCQLRAIQGYANEGTQGQFETDVLFRALGTA